MGWGSGRNHEGRQIGYMVEAVCDFPGCDTKIDRGLAYCCGGLDGVDGEQGCGQYFCYEHLTGVGLCFPCVEKEDLR